MKHWVLGLVLSAASVGEAGATPLGAMWRQDKACGGPVVATTADGLVQIERGALSVRSRATGKSQARVALPRGIAAERVLVAGDTLVVVHAKGVIGLGLDGKTRWKRAERARVYVDVADKDVVLAYDAKTVPGKRATRMRIDRVNGATGAAAWTTDVPSNGTVRWIGASAAHVYGIEGGDAARRAVTVHAFDRATGELAWTSEVKLRMTAGALAVLDDDLVITEYTLGVHVVAGKSGASTALAVRDAVDVAVGHDQIYVKTTVPTIVALDRKVPRWTVPATDFLMAMEAGRDAVFLVDGAGIARALDPVTGKERASFGVGGAEPSVHVGAPALTTCIGTTLVAIDPSIDTAAEAATVTGRFTCKDCTSNDVKVRIGDATVDVDEHGAFTAKVTGRGWLEARYQTSAGTDWSQGTPPLAVELTGKRSYQLAPLVGSDDTLGD